MGRLLPDKALPRLHLSAWIRRVCDSAAGNQCVESEGEVKLIRFGTHPRRYPHRVGKGPLYPVMNAMQWKARYRALRDWYFRRAAKLRAENYAAWARFTIL